MADDGDVIPTTDEDEAARLADELPPVTASRRRRSREVMSRRARTDRRPRCAACGYFFSSIDSWTCPRCAADLREVGFTRPVSLRGRIASQLRAVVRRLRRKQRSGMACGKCEYPTRGIGGFECPECGSDLRKVGIIDRDRIHRGSLVVMVLATWSLVVLAMAMVLTDWLHTWAAPQRMSRETSARLESPGPLITLNGTSPAVRPSEVYSVEIDGRGAITDWRWHAVPLRRMTVTLKRGEQYSLIYWNLEDDRFILSTGLVFDLLGKEDRATEESPGLDRTVVLDAMRRIDLNVDDAATQAQATELMKSILAIEADTFDAASAQGFVASGRSTVTVTPSQSYRMLIELYWLAFWAIGSAALGWVVWRWGRRGTSAATEPQNS